MSREKEGTELAFFSKRLFGAPWCATLWFSEVTSGLVIGFFFFFLASNSFSISGERGLSAI